MKVQAIGARGSRRDFVDLYVVAREYGLREIFQWFTTKYSAVSYSRTHYLKALTYFQNAEAEPLPHLLVPLDWREVVRFFVSETPRLAHL